MLLVSCFLSLYSHWQNSEKRSQCIKTFLLKLCQQWLGVRFEGITHDIYTVNGITIRTLRLDFTRNYNVLSFRHKVSQQYLVVCWLWRLGPCLNSTLWVRSSPGAFSNFFVGGSKVDPKLHPIHKGTCGDTIHSINTMSLTIWLQTDID